MNSIKTRPCVGDAVAVALCVLLCLASAALLILSGRASASAESVVITTVDGELTYTLDTERTVDITSNGIKLTVRIENGTVAVLSSDCPDGVCVGTGRIASTGQSIVCVPARVTVRLQKKEARDADLIIG